MKQTFFILTLLFWGLTLSPASVWADSCTRHCGVETCSRDCDVNEVADCSCNVDGTAHCGCALAPVTVEHSCSVQCAKGSCDKSCSYNERAICSCTHDIAECGCASE